MKRFVAICAVLSAALLVPSLARSESAAELIEKARAEAREYEKLKRIIVEEPNQNVRLAAFELMMNAKSQVMRQIAIDAGLTSADELLRAAAFKAATLDLERLHLTLDVDSTASKEIQAKSNEFLAKTGNTLVLPLGKKDPEKGVFVSGRINGEITGVHISFVNQYDKGVLNLVDDDTVKGAVTVWRNSAYLQFIATGKIR